MNKNDATFINKTSRSKPSNIRNLVLFLVAVIFNI